MCGLTLGWVIGPVMPIGYASMMFRYTGVSPPRVRFSGMPLNQTSRYYLSESENIFLLETQLRIGIYSEQSVGCE